ncbi:MAG TPA: STAS domain-containing protein [Terriglobia bacterium]|nr:STAS domain-containing protein [Terriglobia bacterium]
MSAVIKSRQLDDVVVLDISGRITLGEGTITLRDALQKLLNRGERKVLMNLEDVDYVDSAGLGELITAFTTVRAHGGQLKLLKLTHRIHDLLQITKLLTVFDSFDNETEAIKSMR